VEPILDTREAIFLGVQAVWWGQGMLNILLTTFPRVVLISDLEPVFLLITQMCKKQCHLLSNLQPFLALVFWIFR
jgi:hypothetical protein